MVKINHFLTKLKDSSVQFCVIILLICPRFRAFLTTGCIGPNRFIMNKCLLKTGVPVLLSSIFFLLTIAAVPQPKDFLPVQAPSVDQPSSRLPLNSTPYFTGTVAAAAPNNVIRSSQPITWRDPCMSQRMEIIGTGLQEEEPTPVTQKTMLLTEPVGGEWLIAQVAGRYSTAHQLPESVMFTTNAPQSITLSEPTSYIPAKAYIFETLLTPTNQVSASIYHTESSYTTPRGLILYARRQTDDEQWISIGQTTNAFVWSGSTAISHTELLTLEPRSGPTDLYITAAIIDNNDDDRPLVLEASAGDHTTQITENGPTHGNLLSIIPLTLTQVSSAATQVIVTLHSPVEENGDSLVFVGVNVSYRCSDNTPTPTPTPIGPAEADLEVVKMVDNSEPNATDIIVYTTTVINNGPDEVTTVQLGDPLPAGLTYVPPYKVSSDTTYNEESGVWTIKSLVKGAKATLTISAMVNKCMNGRTITATAKVLTADQLDPIPDNNQGSRAIQVGSGTPCYVYMPVVFKDYCAGTYYMDKFDDPTSGWITGTYAEADYSYEPKPVPKEYRIFAKDRDSYPTSFSVSPFGSFKQYTIKVDVKWDNPPLGDEYGIIFGVRGTNDPRITGGSILLYRFVVNTRGDDNEFLLTRYDGQKWIPLIDWRTDNSHIYNGTSLNTLQVMCSDSNAAIHANGNLLWQGSLPASCSGEFGLTSSSSYTSDDPKTDARFDNFKICGAPELSNSSKNKVPAIIVANDSNRPHN